MTARRATSIVAGLLVGVLFSGGFAASAAAESPTRLKDTAPFRVGVAIDQRETAGAAAGVVSDHFDQVTAENHMKPDAWYDGQRSLRIHPQAAAIMDFASQRGIEVYGHTLVWHSQTPGWFFQNSAGQPLSTSETDRALLRERMRTHIFGVARILAERNGPFGGGNPVTSFDVVNEVISDGGEADGLRRSEWYRVLGEEFIDLAFRYADEAFNVAYAAPGSERPVALFINDYSTEYAAKRARYVALVDRLLARDVPIDGVGHQFHVNLGVPTTALAGAIDAFAQHPVTQAVTELDVPTGVPVTTSGLDAQRAYYRAAFEVFHARAAMISAVTVWGLNDARSWRAASGAPLLFFDDLTPKPALLGAIEAAPAPTLGVAATSRCVAGRAVLLVTVRNDSDTSTAVSLTTPYGTRELAPVAPGATTTLTFSTRAARIPAGLVSATAGGSSATYGVDAMSCDGAPRT